MYRFYTAFLLLLTVYAADPAYSAETVVNTLRVTRIVRQANGVDRKEDAASAKPGDLLEYDATYRNDGSAAARQLQATVPIPSGSIYVADSTLPSKALASVDGVTYAPLPLKRKVRQADGTVVERAVELSEYRFIRWTLDDLAAGAMRTVSVRVSIPNDVIASTAQVQK